jgi:hypothetical protein
VSAARSLTVLDLRHDPGRTLPFRKSRWINSELEQRALWQLDVCNASSRSGLLRTRQEATTTATPEVSISRDGTSIH